MNQNIFTGKFSRNKRKTTLTQYLRHKLTFSSDRYLMVFGPKTEFPRYSSIHFSHFFYDPQLIQSPSLTPSAIPPPPSQEGYKVTVARLIHIIYISICRVTGSALCSMTEEIKTICTSTPFPLCLSAATNFKHTQIKSHDTSPLETVPA